MLPTISELVPNARCADPAAVSWPVRLPPLPDGSKAASALLAHAKRTCKNSRTIERVESILKNATGHLAPLSGDQPPLRPHGLCRGEAMLHATSGMALAFFGPGLIHCAANRLCWFALADCGKRRGQDLSSLLIRARFVGQRAIFVPHLAYLPISSGGDAVLIAWYCPPIAGNYSLDARLQWLLTTEERVRADGALGEALLRRGSHSVPSPRLASVGNRGSSFTSGIKPRRLVHGNKAYGAGGGALHRAVPHARSTSDLYKRSTPLGRQLLAPTTSGLPPRGEIFLGGIEPRCPRNSNPATCPYAFENALGLRTAQKCESAARIGGERFAALQPVLVVTDDAARSPRGSDALKQCSIGHERSLNHEANEYTNGQGYWSALASNGPGTGATGHGGSSSATGLPPEEGGHSDWVWANRLCHRKPLTRAAARRCLHASGHVRIHFHGDSIARDLYVAFANFLGLPVLSRSEMKHRTNVLKIMLHGTEGAEQAVPGGGSGGDSTGGMAKKSRSQSRSRLQVTYGMTWGMLRDPSRLFLELQHIRPQVLVTNFALYHGGFKWLEHWVGKWREYTSSERSRSNPNDDSRSANYTPPVLIHQRVGALQGARGYGPLGIQDNDAALGTATKALGFVHLDSRLPHYSRFDATDDGGHVRINGTTMLDLARHLVELVCSS